MIFFFKKKDIVLDCFTYEEGVIRTAPIVPAVKNSPEWWRELPPYANVEGVMYPFRTAKYCTGIINYFAKSLVMPLWSDLLIKVEENGAYRWQFADGHTEADVHNTEIQTKGFLPTHGHLKIVAPWCMKTKEEIYWMWSHPVWCFPNNNDLVSLPAILDYKWQHTANVNLLINLTKKQDFNLKMGQSLVHITPLSDRKVKIVRHLVSKEEFNNIQPMNPTFYNNYKVRRGLLEKFADCPFKRETK